MPTYEHTITIDADPDAIFAFASDPENMPKYQSTVKEAHAAGDDEKDGRSRIEMKGEADGHPYEGEGWIEYRDGANEMTWGAVGQSDYTGKLSVSPAGAVSQVTVTLSFTANAGHEDEFDAQWADRDERVRSSLSATLQSLKNQIEGDGGKVASTADSDETVAPGR